MSFLRLKKGHWVGIIAGLFVFIIDLILFHDRHNLFLFLVGISVSCMAIPFIINLMVESKREQEINSMFLEFSRNLAESVNTGTPISKSIVNMKKKRVIRSRGFTVLKRKGLQQL